MNELKPLNETAERMLAAKGDEPVRATHTVFPLGCTTALNPGVEVGPHGSVASLCTPWQADLYGCSEPCYWPASVPDSITYPEWSAGVVDGDADWRSLGQIYPTESSLGELNPKGK